MTDQVEIQIPKPRINEGTAFTATAYFRTRSTKAASTPTNVYYRVDCLTTGQVVRDWTQVSTPSTSNAISLTSADNKIQSKTSRFERKQLIVQADRGLSGQATGRATWKVRNLRGIE